MTNALPFNLILHRFVESAMAVSFETSDKDFILMLGEGVGRQATYDVGALSEHLRLIKCKPPLRIVPANPEKDYAEAVKYIAWPGGAKSDPLVMEAIERFKRYFLDPEHTPVLWHIRDSYQDLKTTCFPALTGLEIAEAVLGGTEQVERALILASEAEAQEFCDGASPFRALIDCSERVQKEILALFSS